MLLKICKKAIHLILPLKELHDYSTFDTIFCCFYALNEFEYYTNLFLSKRLLK